MTVSENYSAADIPKLIFDLIGTILNGIFENAGSFVTIGMSAMILGLATVAISKALGFIKLKGLLKQ